MKPTSIDFKIQGRHESHSGSAVIVDTWLDIDGRAKEAFGAQNVTVRSIGQVNIPGQQEYIDTYEIYETYLNSASNDYYYFAVMLSSQEA